MHVFSFVARRLFSLAACSCLLVLLTAGPASAFVGTTNAPPSILLQPTNAIAGSGEDIAFTVVATDTNTPPLALTNFQWRVNGFNLTGANVVTQTNGAQITSTLVVSNLAVSASYSVVIANTATNVVSSNANLLLVNPVPRRLGTGLITASTNSGTTNVFVPITLRGTGRENFVSFTLLFTNAFTNTMFSTTNANVTITTNLTLVTLTNFSANPTNANGPLVTNVFISSAAGISFKLSSGTLAPGLQTLGTFQFDLAGNSPAVFDAALQFATNAAPVVATNVNGLGLTISANIEPCLEPISSEPTFQPVSGYFISQMLVKNPSMNVMSAVDVLALKLGSAVSNVLVSNNLGVVVGTNLVTNLVTYANAQGTNIAFPAADPVIFAVTGGGSNCPVDLTGTTPALPYAQLYDLQPGEARVVTLEFDVPGSPTTLSNAAFALFRGTQLNPVAYVNLTPLPLTSNGMSGATFYLEFNTLKGHTYYIQYVDQLPFSFTNGSTVFPGVAGTGGVVRWVDNGSPKTDLPFKGAHFYRIFESF